MQDCVTGASDDCGEPWDEWRYRVRTIPDIRSALIVPDGTEEAGGWSSTFSLPKADLEPWLSFFQGYQSSSLFAGPARPLGNEAPAHPPALQFEVQAILALRGLEARLILEPPVQIKRPVDYLDLIAEVDACRDPILAKGLAHIANEVHDSRLAQALENGREMGDRLYQALLGVDCINLICTRNSKACRRRKACCPSPPNGSSPGSRTSMPRCSSISTSTWWNTPGFPV